MQKRPFMIIVLAILLVQPVVVGLSMPFSFNLVEPSRALAQDAGFSVDPTVLSPHVPVHIDGTAEFTSQGWPGAGTPADPFVIAELNITTDAGFVCINIVNTNASFVIRDCYIQQDSDEVEAVHFENVTAGTIEYSTIIGNGYWPNNPLDTYVHLNNANNTVVSHVYSFGDLGMPMYVSNCNNTTYEFSIFECVEHRALRVDNSDYCTVSESTIISNNMVGWWAMRFDHVNHTSLDNLDVSCEGAAAGISMNQCYFASISDVYMWGPGSTYGLDLAGCPDIVVSGITIEALFTGVYVTSSPGLSLLDISISDVTGDGIFTIASPNSSVSNIDIDGTGNYGMTFQSCVNSTFSDIWINYTGSSGFFSTNNAYLSFDNLNIRNTGNIGLHVVNAENVTLTNSNFENTNSHAIDVNTGANWTITDNTFLNIGGDGITHLAGVNLVIMRNYMDFVGAGIIIENDVNATIIDNHITEASGDGLYVETCFQAQIVDNTVDGAEIGLYLIDSDNVTVENNQFHENSEQGIYYDQCDNGIIRENDIIGGPLGGISMTGSLNAEIVNNTLVDCGIVTGGMGSMAEFLHVIEDNTVNGLPVYYNPGATGGDILASDYGQVLLVNNTWMKVHDGDFGLATMPVEIGYSSECELWNLDTTENYIGIGLLWASNITLHNITHNGGLGSSGIAAFYTVNVTILDSEFIDCYDSGGAVWGTNVNDLYIADSLFDGNDIGVMISTGTDILISNNQFLNTEDEAIYFSSSSSDYIRVLNNEFLNATTGIYSDNADNWTIMQNTFMYCSSYAIYFGGSSADYANITMNTIENNHHGIRISLGDDASITNNTIMWNTGHGVYLDQSANTEVYYNIFAMNLQDNGHDTVAGIWDDTVDTGNWWDDFTPPAPYSVPGSGGAVDNYPMNYNVSEPIISQPQDIYYAEDSEDNEILWYAFDDSLKNWVVTIDGGAWVADAWNFDNITVNIDGLPYGTHTLVITLWDVDLNDVTDTVLIHVFDGTPPEISNTPNGEVFVQGTGQTLSWEVSDLHPDTYTAYLDGEVWDTGSWTSDALEISVDGMLEGEHSLLMVVSDIDGNIAQDQVLLRVTSDDVDPVVDSPDDFTYVLGDTGNVIVWEPSDEHPSLYNIGYYSSIIVEEEWAGSRLVLNVDGLTNGTHSFYLTVFDGAGNTAEDAVVVTVVLPTPETPPPPPPVDLGFIGLVVAVIGVAAVVVVVIVLFLKKRKPY